MQLAERSRATAAIAVCAASVLVTAPFAMAMSRAAHRHHGHHRVDLSRMFDTPRCSDEPAHHAVTAPVVQPAAITYDGVLAAAQPLFEPCFGHDGRATELLVTIAPDGRVRATTTRPEPETHASRCLASVVRGLVFPPAETTVMMRVPLHP